DDDGIDGERRARGRRKVKIIQKIKIHTSTSVSSIFSFIYKSNYTIFLFVLQYFLSKTALFDRKG
ncbi:MAG: hypothetical protein II517_01950, partial [Ruminococcus sp.]|nr:hypothetical protein [Ruminococcus sp.]